LPTATIIGAGVFGAWTARALKDRGWDVTLIDQHGPGNSRASSGGETRIIRSGYGDVSLYARWARDSMPKWLELERVAGETLVVHTGALFVGSNTAWLRATMTTLEQEGVPAEWLEPTQLASRYPALDFGDGTGGVFEPRAGVLYARRAVQALVRTLQADGVVYHQRAVDPTTEIRDNQADALIFACGPWLPALFPAVLRDVIMPTRQEVFFFGAPAGDLRFSADQLPAWVAFDEGVYGLPDLDHRGVKVAIDAHGEDADPERMDRSVSATSVTRMRQILHRRLPALADAPLLEARVCQYENTTNGHLLVDRLPDHDRVWIAGGGSGHGFKHGPMLGEYVASLVEGSGTPNPLLALGGRPPRQRAVY
jgi:sarcosine oxidase